VKDLLVGALCVHMVGEDSIIGGRSFHFNTVFGEIVDIHIRENNGHQYAVLVDICIM
jgi:hypothetical protein